MDRDLEECRSLTEYDREREREELRKLEGDRHAFADPPGVLAFRARMNEPAERQVRVTVDGETWLLFAHWNSTGGKEYFLARDETHAVYLLGQRGIPSPLPFPVRLEKWSKGVL